jgi:hypothetical protein
MPDRPGPGWAGPGVLGRVPWRAGAQACPGPTSNQRGARSCILAAARGLGAFWSHTGLAVNFGQALHPAEVAL